ncbi:MAG TPA: carboxypeptidase M32 [Candidatus Eisenbacteria bacterium]|nr:carboxypeptidase M32 [Candidatus Eisenbacteria bacterium]
MKSLEALKIRLREVDDLHRASAVLQWDQATYMPPGGARGRGRQIATLSRLAHETFTAAETGRLLDAAASETASLPFESDEASIVRVTRRSWDLAVRRPASLVGEFQEHQAKSYQAWTAARPANDFASMRPYLEKTLEFSRRTAECYPGFDHIADPMINFYDYGMKASSVRTLFATLRDRLVPLVRAISSRPLADNGCILRNAPAADQLAFGVEVITKFGYDWNRGRQDLTHHPFQTTFSPGDVRITTRVQENDLTDALFSTLHEAGHALYEQGVDPALEGTPLAGGTSAGVHESQSRLWENLVGRSRGFWEHFYPRLKAAFPSQLKDVAPDAFYRAVNRVERTLIRTDADEVTYNLHVMLRFDLELELLEGKLAVKDLARVWRERIEADLGQSVPDDRRGVLQDVHWYGGPIGGVFQGYTLGNILSAQFYDCAVKAHPEIPSDVAAGEFARLHGWLKENIYRHGSKFTAPELVRRVTGGDLTIEPYLDYLWRKYQPLYGLREEERQPAGVR